MEVPIKNVNISSDLRLKLWKNRNIINLARKVNNIVDIYTMIGQEIMNTLVFLLLNKD